jgi:hypothetical protein
LSQINAIKCLCLIVRTYRLGGGGTVPGGGAKPTDTHLDSIVHCVNGEIVEWLEQREQYRDEDNGDAAR